MKLKIKNLSDIIKDDADILHICEDFGFIIKNGIMQKVFKLFVYGRNGLNYLIIPEAGYEDFIEEAYQYLKTDMIVKDKIWLVDSVEIVIFPDNEPTRFEFGCTAIKITVTAEHANIMYKFSNFWGWESLSEDKKSCIGYSKTKDIFIKDSNGEH
jgi:hypothetical protein